jgi:hypothetical protein
MKSWLTHMNCGCQIESIDNSVNLTIKGKNCDREYHEVTI